MCGGKSFCINLLTLFLKIAKSGGFLILEVATEVFCNLERKTFERLIFQLFFATIIKKFFTD